MAPLNPLPDYHMKNSLMSARRQNRTFQAWHNLLAIIKKFNTMEPKDVVISFLMAMNQEDFQEARTYVNDDLRFVGVMGSRDGADAYFRDMEHMKFKYDIRKVFQDEETSEVCIFYDINMSGKTIFSCGWYKVTNDKIDNFRVLFDPRPLL
jgi:limonene-1,2-epoxide hydrolase